MVEKGTSRPPSSASFLFLRPTHSSCSAFLLILGVIYRRHRPTYYSPSSRTALAEAELVYKDDHVSQSVYVRLEVDALSDGLKAALGEKKGAKVGLAIWTTTPWSLASNMVSLPFKFPLRQTGRSNDRKF